MIIEEVFKNNKKWVASKLEVDENYFTDLSKGQSPELLYIGCSDSRVTAEELMGVEPGEAFVHRNIANMVISIDLNAMSVINYAINHLKVNHVVVCGHYGCGGVKAALETDNHGLIDNWLFHIKKSIRTHSKKLETVQGDKQVNLMCELNVIEQVNNVCHTTIVQEAWTHGIDVSVHGWIYGLEDGLIKDLQVSVSNNDELAAMEENLYKE